MTTIAPAQSKITYTSASVDWELFHRQFDDALARVRGQLGGDYPLYIAGEAVPLPAPPIIDRSPIDTGVVLGRFTAATPPQVDRAVSAARAGSRRGCTAAGGNGSRSCGALPAWCASVSSSSRRS